MGRFNNISDSKETLYPNTHSGVVSIKSYYTGHALFKAKDRLLISAKQFDTIMDKASKWLNKEHAGDPSVYKDLNGTYKFLFYDVPLEQGFTAESRPDETKYTDRPPMNTEKDSGKNRVMIVTTILPPKKNSPGDGMTKVVPYFRAGQKKERPDGTEKLSESFRAYLNSWITSKEQLIMESAEDSGLKEYDLPIMIEDQEFPCVIREGKFSGIRDVTLVIFQ
jgi:hypothetical protein